MSPPRRDASGALRRSAPVFAALGDRTRLTLVKTLSEGPPRSIARLTQGSALTRQAITKHLRVLEGAGLVRAERRGRESLYALEPAPIDEARRALERISREWDVALARLRSFVEE
jgi:DNA-binding transcriptional ArsR family regulator